MYEWLKRLVEQALRVPPAPGPPPGDEGTTRLFRASPRYYLYRLIGWILARLSALLGIAVAAGSTYLALREAGTLGSWLMALEIAVVGLFLLQTVFSYVALRLDYEKRWYLVTDRSLRIREGVLNVREMTITFANIQNISISQGPLQRLFGISDVRVDTAGGSSGQTNPQQSGMSLHTAFFRGVDNADSIRSLMQQRLWQLKDAGLGDTDDAGRAAGAAAPVVAGTDPVLAVLRQIRGEARALRASLERGADSV